MKIQIKLAIMALVLGSMLAQESETLSTKTITHQKGPPLVGVLYQPGMTSFKGLLVNPDKNYNYLFRSYEKWISQTGALPVLIPYDLDRKTFVRLVSQMQMMLIPGGEIRRYNEAGEAHPYQLRVELIYNIAKKKQESGQYWPIWATCQGFQQLSNIMGSSKTNIVCDFDARSSLLKVHKGKDYAKTKFWNNLNKELRDRVWGNSKIYFFNACGLSLENFDKTLTETAYLTSFAYDKNGRAFVTSMEHKTLPIYATQWHPEKNQFEKLGFFDWVPKDAQNLRMMRDMAFVMVDKVRDQAKALNDVDPLVRQYFSLYQQPKRLNAKNSQFYVRRRNRPSDHLPQ